MRNLLNFLIIVVAGCTETSTLTVLNDSSFEIDQLMITSVDHDSWGSNLLRGNPLAPGGTVSIDVGCGTYDALLVDSTHKQCELDSVELCFSDATWVLRNDTCAVFAK